MNTSVEAFGTGAKMVRPYLHLTGQEAKIPLDIVFAKGVQLLESCANTDFWEANWFLGKAYEAMGEYNKSALRFAMAYAIATDRKEVIHEYVIALLRINEGIRAEKVADKIRDSCDPLLRFDFALVMLKSNNIKDALHAIDSFDWPFSFQENVKRLRNQITEIAERVQ